MGYLRKVRSSKGTKRSISEETMAALAKMMKDPKRKPTMDEMEELLNRAKSFKEVSTVRAAEEKKRDSPRSPERGLREAGEDQVPGTGDILGEQKDDLILVRGSR